jgi:hypothetical protein
MSSQKKLKGCFMGVSLLNKHLAYYRSTIKHVAQNTGTPQQVQRALQGLVDELAKTLDLPQKSVTLESLHDQSGVFDPQHQYGPLIRQLKSATILGKRDALRHRDTIQHHRQKLVDQQQHAHANVMRQLTEQGFEFHPNTTITQLQPLQARLTNPSKKAQLWFSLLMADPQKLTQRLNRFDTVFDADKDVLNFSSQCQNHRST